jgi:RND family efflux transporter MFP subunit
LAAALLLAQGLFSRHRAFAALQTRSNDSAVLAVTTTRASVGGSGDLLLPGTLLTQNEANLYARSQGYVKRLHADIGQQVKTGQLLAEIDTPELDEQLRQARADEATSRATEELARSTAARWQALFDQKLVARQATEEKLADARAKRAALDAQAANVSRLTQLQGFRRIVAPFDGTVTARNADVGQLVTAAGATNAAGGAAPLFRIASRGNLKIYVQVPQAQSTQIKTGMTASLTLPERPGTRYAAKVLRSAGAIDPGTRSLRVELSIEDPKGELLPGSFAHVAFAIEGGSGLMRLPVGALIFRAKGTQVAVIGTGGKAAFKPVTVGRDFGTEFEVAAGIGPDDDVVLNPPDSLLEGQPLQRAEAKPRDPSAHP